MAEINWEEIDWDAVEASAIQESSEKRKSIVKNEKELVENVSNCNEPSTERIESLTSPRSSSWTFGTRLSMSNATPTPNCMPSTLLKRAPTASTSNTSAATIVEMDAKILATMKKYWGYEQLRAGQLEVVRHVLCHKDVLVLWATGWGKSLCYQLPPLITNKTAIVVSPLVSLMNDQVNAINSKVGSSIACLVGSMQPDKQVEIDAQEGRYRLVYVTPEKLCGAGFAERLMPLYLRDCIELFAVDEAHCCSEWGHDYRPNFQQIGSILRNAMPKVPILALTATAVQRVVEDVSRTLQLRKPLRSTSSLDRTNLRIFMMKKTTYERDMAKIVDILCDSSPTTPATSFSSTPSQPSVTVKKSSIIYVHSRNDADRLSASLAVILQGRCRVQCYHAGKTNEERKRAHREFLTGESMVVVATIAFGMGIDKSDIRCVIHYGPPQTMEAYLQQIGRAGRDGLEANCYLLYSYSEFSAYEDSFYTKARSAEQNKAIKQSLDYLKAFAIDTSCCRRRHILNYFNQNCPYDRCNTCDNCMALQDYGQDATRDFRDIVFILLSSLREMSSGSKGVSMSNLWKGVKANLSENGRFAEELKRIPKHVKKDEPTLKALFLELVNAKYICEETVKAVVRDFQRSWSEYKLTAQGNHFLTQAPASPQLAVCLPVPLSLRVIEAASRKEIQETLASLVREGTDVMQIPADELERDGLEGEAIKMSIVWSKYMAAKQAKGQTAEVDQLNLTLQLIIDWRDRKAREIGIAPAQVIPEYVAKRVVYSRAFSVQALQDAGVRVVGLDTLASALLDQWASFQPPALSVADTSFPESSLGAKRKAADAIIPVPDTWQPARKNPFVVYKAGPKGQDPAWLMYLKLFRDTQLSLAVIAADNSKSGRPVQVATVFFGVLSSLLYGEAVPLSRLFQEFSLHEPHVLLSFADLEAINSAADQLGVNRETELFSKEVAFSHVKELVQEVLGAGYDLANKEQSEADKLVIHR